MIHPLRNDAGGDAVARTRRDRLGGTEGNELLTSATAALLTALLIGEGLTILWLGDLRTEHMFIGMALVPPVGLKLASTGYRFVRYYARAPTYRRKGPPLTVLRLLAPILVVTTVLVLATGVWLLLLGHRSDLALQLHKLSFIVWGACFAVHFLWYLPRAWTALRASRTAAPRERAAGSGLRGALVSAALGGGLVLAYALLWLIEAWHGGGR